MQVCKNQFGSMLDAGVNSECKFARSVIQEFMKHDWSNKEHWNIKNLWNGTIAKEYQLGKQSMNYLKDGRNAMTTRIAKTVGKCGIKIT